MRTAEAVAAAITVVAQVTAARGAPAAEGLVSQAHARPAEEGTAELRRGVADAAGPSAPLPSGGGGGPPARSGAGLVSGLVEE